MFQKRATIKDIAKYTGYSIATVSRVINNKGVFYGKEAEEKISKVIEELNYTPHAIAREFKNKKAYSIGFIVPYLDDYYTQVFQGIQSVANDKGYSVALLNSNCDVAQEKINLKNVSEQRYSGIIIATGLMDNNAVYRLRKETATVSVGKVAENLNIPYVTINNYEITKEAVNYLISLGHRRIAFFCSHLTTLTEKERYNGYIDALHENSLRFDPSMIFESSVLVKSFSGELYELIKSFIEESNNITAFLMSSDYIAITSIKVLKDMGKKVPEDISVIGFDNIPFTEYAIPTITTISQNKLEIGRRSMETLLKIIEGEPVDNITINAELLIRESTAAVKKTD